MKKNLGGDRLGSGAKMNVDLHGYGRSTHDLGYIWRSTMAAGTLVPFMSIVGLPGDTFDINLDAFVNTHPTIGPLFGSFKLQLDMFMCPVRLYQGQLHNNKLGIGMDMSAVKLPIMRLYPQAIPGEPEQDVKEYSQVNPSCLLAYLGIRGIGWANPDSTDPYRDFNAVPLLAYWDIYKNYYANKQEEVGFVLHTNAETIVNNVIGIEVDGNTVPQYPSTLNASTSQNSVFVIQVGAAQPLNQIEFYTNHGTINGTDLGEMYEFTGSTYYIAYNWQKYGSRIFIGWNYVDPRQLGAATTPSMQQFQLDNIDVMRERILATVQTPTAFNVTEQADTYNIEPYVFMLSQAGASNINPIAKSQEGLGLKTYQSDLFNNWLSTEWIDGTNGISAVTAIDTSGGSFTLDTLNLAKKVYDMLNRIAVSGGSYQDWMDANWMNNRVRMVESPVYQGGLSKEIIFQEVISQSESSPGQTGSQPLGTLGGRGTLGSKHKGGKVIVHCEEICYLLAIASITPRLDYSQGNTWDVNLQTLNDFHKPALDGIGFQELIQEQMAWWTTYEATADSNIWTQQSAGKQPAWINYMTNINRTYGNFAIEDNEMWMTLNRKYRSEVEDNYYKITDLTTYIDPAKYNSIFAQTTRDSQNFWVQIGVDVTARRMMSGKIIPNI